MSVPQGTSAFNTAYFASLTNRINSASSCSELQALVTEAFQSLQGVKDAITSQVALLEPIESLLTGPTTDPSAIVSWISTFITAFLTPYVKPLIAMATQLTSITTEVAALTSAIESAQAKFPSCSISIPSI